MTRELPTVTVSLPGGSWFLTTQAKSHRNAHLWGCGRKPGVCLPFQSRGELCVRYKSAFQIKQSTGGWRPQAQAALQEREARKGSMIDPASLFWMLGSIPRDNWDCSRELGREMVSRVLLEQLVCDCHIKMIQAEWYLMIYGVRPPVPTKAWY